MRNVYPIDKISKQSIQELTKGEKVDNDIFCVERKREYRVFFKLEPFGLLFLGESPSVSGAMYIMDAFILGSLAVNIGQIKHN